MIKLSFLENFSTIFLDLGGQIPFPLPPFQGGMPFEAGGFPDRNAAGFQPGFIENFEKIKKLIFLG